MFATMPIMNSFFENFRRGFSDFFRRNHIPYRFCRYNPLFSIPVCSHCLPLWLSSSAARSRRPSPVFVSGWLSADRSQVPAFSGHANIAALLQAQCILSLNTCRCFLRLRLTRRRRPVLLQHLVILTWAETAVTCVAPYPYRQCVPVVRRPVVSGGPSPRALSRWRPVAPASVTATLS